MIYIVTHAGIGKDVSEDTVLVGNQLYSDVTDTAEIPEDGFICVADGVGGNNAGEEASSFVLQALSECKWEDDDALHKRLTDIHRQLIEKSKEDGRLSRMATTLSGLCVRNGEMKLIHIGNTRVYAMQGHYLKQLTPDHTVYRWLQSLGRVEEAEACNKNEITNCFGGGDEKLIEKLLIVPVNSVNLLLITSDGIHEYVSIDDLEDILNSDIPDDEKCSAIQEAAQLAGSTDDMTAVLICVQEGE